MSKLKNMSTQDLINRYSGGTSTKKKEESTDNAAYLYDRYGGAGTYASMHQNDVNEYAKQMDNVRRNNAFRSTYDMYNHAQSRLNKKNDLFTQAVRQDYNNRSMLGTAKNAVGQQFSSNPTALSDSNEYAKQLQKYLKDYEEKTGIAYDKVQKLEKAYGNYDRNSLEKLKEHYQSQGNQDEDIVNWIDNKLVTTATTQENKGRQAAIEKQLKQVNERIQKQTDRINELGFADRVYTDEELEPIAKDINYKLENLSAEKDRLENELKGYQANLSYKDEEDYDYYKQKGEENKYNKVNFYRNYSDEESQNELNTTLPSDMSELDKNLYEEQLLGAENSSDKELYRNITQEEADNYSYLLGKYGEDKADEYLQQVAFHTDVNNEAEKIAKARETGYKHGAEASIESIGLGLLTPFEAAKNALGGDTFRTSDDYTLANRQNALRQGTTEKIVDVTGSKTVLPFVYNTGMSTADNLLRWAVGSGVGSVAGGSAAGINAVSKTGENVMRGMMAGQVMDQAMADAFEKGLSDEQAVATAIVSAFNEELFETLSLENLKALKTTDSTALKDIIKNAGKQFVTEGSEEVFTDIGNAIADDLINGENSEINKTIEQYISEGMTPEEASKQAAIDFAMQLVESGLSGGLSGATMGAMGTRKLRKADKVRKEMTNTLVESGLSEDDAQSRVYDVLNNSKSLNKAKKSLNEMVEKLSVAKNEMIAGVEADNNAQESIVNNINEEEYIAPGETIAENATVENNLDYDELYNMYKNVNQMLFNQDNAEQTELNQNANTNNNIENYIANIEKAENGQINASESNKKEYSKFDRDLYDLLSTTPKDVNDTKGWEKTANKLSEMYKQYPDKQDTVLSDAFKSINNMTVNDFLNSYFGENFSYNDFNTQNQAISEKLEDVKPLKYAKLGNENVEIVSANNDNVTIKNADGKENTVNISDLNLSEGTKAVVEQAAKYGKKGSKVFLANLSSDPVAYTLGFDAIYNAGKNGGSFYNISASNVSSLSKNYRNARNLAYEVYSAGVSDNTKKSKVGGLVRNENRHKINERTASVLNMMGKSFGVVIQIDDVLDKDANGLYEDGRIHISRHADNPALVVFAHEFTHRLEETSPEAYKQYEDYIIDMFKELAPNAYKARVASLEENYRNRGVELSKKDIRSELAANATEMFLMDEDAVDRIASENLSLAKKIANVLKELIQELKDFIGGNERYSANTVEARIISENKEVFEKALDLWLKAIKEQEKAKENAKDNESKYSFSEENIKKLSNNEYTIRNMFRVAKMDPVYTLYWKYNKKDGSINKDLISGTINTKKGNIIYKELNEIIDIDENSEDNLKAHLFSGRYELIESIRKVIENGYAVDYQADRKVKNRIDEGKSIRKYDKGDFVTIAAPVVFKDNNSNKKIYIVGVSIKITDEGNHLYTIGIHNINDNKINKSYIPGALISDDLSGQLIRTQNATLNINSILKDIIFVKKYWEDLDNINPDNIRVLNRNSNKDTYNYSLKEDSEGRTLSKQQQEYFKDSKAVDEKGRLKEFYHGTNAGNFNIFDMKYLGTGSGDTGFFGKGFYFAFSEGEARMYGNNVKKVYLNATNPYYFKENLFTMEDGSTSYNEGEDAIFAYQFSKKFPELAKKHTISTWNEEGEHKSITFKEFAKQFDDVLKNKKFTISKEKDDYTGNTYYVARTDKTTHSENGYTWDEYGYERTFIDKKSAEDKIFNAYEYLNEVVYDGVKIPDFKKIIMEEEFADNIRNKGYDSIFQSKYGDEAVVFDSNQIKNVDNENPTENPDIRFNLKEPVEETRNLIAVHNGKPEEVIKTLKLGGFPSPSIAILKAGMGHENFGPISFVFYKDTVDPEASNKNVVYGGDAWTPVFPRIDRKFNGKNLIKLHKTLGLTGDYSDYFNDNIDNIVFKLKNDTNVMQKYIESNNIPIEKKQKVNYKYFASDRLADYIVNNNIKSLYEITESEKLQNKIADFVFPEIKDDSPNFMKFRKKTLINALKTLYLDLSDDEFVNFVLENYEKQDQRKIFTKYQEEIASDVNRILKKDFSTEFDEYAYRQDIFDYVKKHDKEFSEYLKKTIEDADIYEGEYIRRTNVDAYDEKKDRWRTFNEMHLPITLENVVKEMNKQTPQGNANFFGGATTLRAAAEQRFKSIEDIKNKSGKIQKISEEEIDNIKSQLNAEIRDIIEDIGKELFKTNDPYILGILQNDVTDSLINIFKKGKFDKKSIKKEFNWTDKIDITDDLVKRLSEYNDKIQDIPRPYFESKPRRAVGFNEVAYSVIPNDSTKELIDLLKENNINYVEYEAGNEEDRKEKLNSRPDVRFSLKEDSPITNNTIAEVTSKNELLADEIRNLEDILTSNRMFFKANQRELFQVYDEIAKEYKINNYSKKQFADNMNILFEYIADVDNPDAVTTMTLATMIAYDMIDKAGIKDNWMQEEYNGLQDFIKATRFKIADQDKNDLDGGYDAFRKKYFGKLTLAKDGISVDSKYQELNGMYPELFPESITHPAEQLTRIGEVMDMFDTVIDSVEGATKEESAFIIARDILDKTLFNSSKGKEFDNKEKLRFQEKLRKSNSNLRRAKKDIKEEYEILLNKVKAIEGERKRLERANQRLENQMGKQQKDFADFAADEKALKKAGKLQRENERLKARFARQEVAKQQRKYSQERRKNLEKIKKMTNELSRSLLHPDKTHYVPRGLVASMLEVAKMIDLDSGYRNPDGSMTNIYMKLKEMQNQYKKMSEDGDYAISSEYNETVEKAIGRIAEITKGKRVNELMDKDIEEVANIMTIINHELKVSRDIINGENLKDVKEAAEKGISQIKAANRVFNKDKKLKNLLNGYLNNMLSPVRVFKRLENYAQDGVMSEIGHMLEQGERKTKVIKYTATDMLADLTKDKEAIKKYEEFRTKKLNYTIGGKTITITPDMRVAIYLHSLNEQNMKHLSGNKDKDGVYHGGGVIIPNYNKAMLAKDRLNIDPTEKYTGVGSVRLSPETVKKIVGDMTDYERQVAEKYREVNNYLTEQLNATTMDLYGFKKATVENYFPLIVDKSILQLESEGLKMDKTLESFGFLKERVNSAKPIYLEGVMDALYRQIDQSSLFSGMAIPTRNFSKVYNYTTQEEGNENGQLTNILKESEKAFGSYMTRYIDNLKADLAQARDKSTSEVAKLFSRGKMATGVLTGNLSVVIKQMASYPTAAGGDLDFRDLIAGLSYQGQSGKDLTELINKYSPYLRDRNTSTIAGMNVTDLNVLQRKNPKLYYALTGWIEATDKATVRRLWYASENYVKRNYKLKVGSDEYYEQVAEVWEDTLRRTQPIYDTMSRPEDLRQTGELKKWLMMFKTQAFQNIGIMVDSYGELRARQEDYKNNKSQVNKEQLQDAQRQFRKAVESQIIQSMVFAAMTALADAIKHRPDDWVDEETGQFTAEAFLKNYADAIINNTIGQLAYGDIIRDFTYGPLKALMGKDTYRFDTEIIPISVINDTLNTVQKMAKYTNKLANLDKNDYATEKEYKTALKGYTDKIAEQAGNIARDGLQYGLGLPINNVEKLLNGITANVEDIRNGKNPLNVTSDTQTYNRIYLAYKTGDTSLAEDLSKDIDNSKIKTQMVNRLKEEDEIKEAADYRYNGETDKYQAIIDAYVNAGFDEKWVVSAVNSDMNKKYGTSGSTTGSIYNANDLERAIDISAVQGSKVANQIYDDKVEDYKAQGQSADDAKKKAFSSVKSSITSKYKSKYQNGSTHEKVLIRDTLVKLRINGTQIYTYEDIKNWNN